MTLEHLKKRECSLHGARRRDRDWLEQILHPDFCEITRSGTLVDRAETIAALVREKGAPAILSADFTLLKTGENSAILRYRTVCPDGSRAALRASYWLRGEDERWHLVFHQGTPTADGD
ncbi:hypothetical protein Sant_1869 [Sodalis praecaptivus]|uniref:DUF4440 domain-containing protein n=1 Tax=Sodalis praecaptivus TaxID=1239307 RepID=W0HSZ1_9GAMM|nr:nuclear transport factor 2 family protein [Sodalis praecaptivus]AHF76921.1 hypothetical protein Sant_1869 [Sodalis praecaptivus]